MYIQTSSSYILQSCNPLRGQPKDQKKKHLTFPFFMRPNIWASCDEISYVFEFNLFL